MKASIISTGEELVHGRVLDTNAAFLAVGIERQGFDVRRIVIIGDEGVALRDELLRCSRDSRLILVSGGLGPTADDRTRWAIAEAAGRPLALDEDTRRYLEERLASFGRKMNEAQLSQATFPQGSAIFPNPRGTARGFACKVGDAWVAAMPGVPVEMHGMFPESVVPFVLRELPPAECLCVETAHLFPIAEPDVDGRIRDLTPFGRNPSVGITVNEGEITVSVTARGSGQAEAEELLQRDLAALRERFGEVLYGYGESTLVSTLAAELEKRGMTIGVAESVTGGLIGHMLVELPGISRYFLSDVVAYGNEAKVSQLGVPREEIEARGAVSAAVAESMARGICAASGCDLGLSTTGIAGPSGGSAEKPVGLVYVGVALGGRAAAARLQLRGGRQQVRLRAAKHALHLARCALVKGLDCVGAGGPR